MKMWRRLYGDVFEGSMAGRKDALVLFMYLVSRADDSGFVRRSGLRVITACTGLTEDEYLAALSELEAPDPASRSKEREGRRLVAEDDGWLIVNFKHYQEIQKEEDRREANRQRVARHRLRKSSNTLPDVTDGYAGLEERRGEESEKRGDESTTGSSEKVGRSSSLHNSVVGSPLGSRSESAPPRGVISLPTNRSETEHVVTESALAELVPLYPALDVTQELRSMRAWLLANPSNRKTAAGTPRFIVNWLNRQQNGARPAAGKRRGVSGAELQELGRRMKEAENGKG